MIENHNHRSGISERAGRAPFVTELSVALPCFNEAGNIENTIVDLSDWFDEAGIEGQIVAVDDGSTDSTAEIIARRCELDPRVVLVRHASNLGYGAAVRSGLDAGTREWIAFMDSDGQFRAADFDKLLPYTREANVVVGRRFERADPLIRRFNARCFGILNRVLFGVWVHDINCAMKMIRRSEWPRLRPRVSTGALFNLELFARLNREGLDWRQVFVNHYPRRAGTQTGANPLVILRALREMALLRLDLWRRV